MARIFQLHKMPSGDYRMILCDDGDDSERRSFEKLLGSEFYETTVLGKTSLMRPGKTPEEFMQHVANENPGSKWEEIAPRVWRWQGAGAANPMP